MNSIAQQESPTGSGQMLFFRLQLASAWTVVRRNEPSASPPDVRISVRVATGPPREGRGTAPPGDDAVPDPSPAGGAPLVGHPRLFLAGARGTALRGAAGGRATL